MQLSESTLVIIASNIVCWAFSAGVVWTRLRAIESLLLSERSEREKNIDLLHDRIGRLSEKLDLHADRITTVETRCREIHRDHP